MSILCVSVSVCSPVCICQVSQWYELVVFTASMEIYGSAVADKLDNNRGILKRRFYRQVKPTASTFALDKIFYDQFLLSDFC